jgi:hypothetical protein
MPPSNGSLTTGEITQLVNRYIGVEGGYLGVPVSFSYRTHEEFYAEYCDLDVTPDGAGTTRQNFMSTLARLVPREQATVLVGILERFPLHEEGAPATRAATELKVREWVARLQSTPGVMEINIAASRDVVKRALSDARTLIAQGKPAHATDRLHTAIHGYLRTLCETHTVTYVQEDGLTRLLRLLQQNVPALAADEQIRKVVNGMSSVLDALSPVRNNQSLAHANDQILDDADAALVINATGTLLHYLEAKLGPAGESS